MSTKTLEKAKMEIIPPIYDFSFKAIFRKENTEIVRDFLQSVLSIPEDEYDKMEFTDTYLNKDHEDDKVSIVDLLIHTKKGKIIHVEMQMADMQGFRKRAIYYNAKLLYKQLKNSEKYDKIEKTITILVTDFPMFDSPGYMRKINLRCEDGELFDDIIEFHTLEIPKVPKEFDGSKKCEWAKFFASRTKEEFSLCAEKNPEIRKAVGVLRELSEDERNQLIAEREEKMRRDHLARIDFGFEQGEKKGLKKGLEKGLEKGREEGIEMSKIEITKNLLINNVALEVISNSTGLSLDTILSIQSEL